MKKSLTLVTIFLCLTGPVTIMAQEASHDQRDSLSYFLTKRDLLSYFRKITDLSDSAYAQSNAKNLLELSVMLQKDFGVMDKSQNKELRRTATIIGQNIYKLTGNLDETLKIYLVAHDHVENKITLDSLAWYIENQIVTLYTMKGDFDKSEYFGNLVETSLKYYHFNKFLSRYYSNLGIRLKSEYKIQKAIETFEKGYSLADSIHYEYGTFSNALNLASIFNEHPNLGSPKAFLLKAGEMLTFLNSDKRFLENKAAFEIESANYAYFQDKYLESIRLFKQAIETLSQYYPNTSRRDFAKYYSSLANNYIHLDSLDQARLNIHYGFACLIPEFKDQDEIPNLNQVYPENSFIDLLSLKAQEFELESANSPINVNIELAIESIELALDVNDMIRETVIADPSKLVTIRDNKELIGKGIEDLYRLSIFDKKEDYFRRARSLFNRSKSLLFNDKTRRNKIAELITASDKEKWASLQDTIRELYQRKFENGADINGINGKILSYQEKIEKIFSTYSSIDLGLKEPDNYIEYFMSDDEIYCLSVLTGQQQFKRIGSTSEFGKLIERLHEFIHLKGLSLDDAILNDMYRFLLGSFTEQLPHHIVIIPDGSIGYVPFEMLKNDLGKYLLDSITISYSFECIAYDVEISPITKPFSIYCLAPQYKTKDVINKDTSRGSIYDLPFAKMEVDSIRNLYGSSALTSQSVDKIELESKLNSTHIFHYAGHAIIQPDKAYLALTDSGNEIEQLTVNEIGIKHHVLDLVVLSACETGLGKMELGEGIRSLGRSFMESGAKSTVISLWNVNDKSTALIMTGFYKHLRDGMRKDEALRQSKLEYLKNSSVRNSHPYFWAAFIPAGDMKALKRK